jgi:hypothetical protein
MALGQLCLAGKALGLDGEALSLAGKARNLPRWHKSPRPGQFLPDNRTKTQAKLLNGYG